MGLTSLKRLSSSSLDSLGSLHRKESLSSFEVSDEKEDSSSRERDSVSLWYSSGKNPFRVGQNILLLFLFFKVLGLTLSLFNTVVIG